MQSTELIYNIKAFSFISLKQTVEIKLDSIYEL